MSTSYLDALPVEVIYRIFDNLNIQTVLLSLRYVSKQFYFTTNSYNRYKFDFKSISKPDVCFICRIVPFENVISLTLSDEDKTRGQIQLFLSLCPIEQFSRLQSLTLLQIEDIHLNIFSKYIITSSLKSLAISTLTLPAREQTTPSCLSRAIAHRSLENLSLDIWPDDWNSIEWSVNCTLNYLRIVNKISLKQLAFILKQAPNLRTLVLKEVHTDDHEEDTYPTSTLSQLTSLSFEHGRIDIPKLEQCLSLTPSLTYLKLIGSGTLFTASFDGAEWQLLIETKLRRLQTFEFFFTIVTYSNYRSRNLELLINSFRSSFWLNERRCSITCDYILNSRKILLYTLPICHTHFIYYTDRKKISLSNFTNRNNANDMDHVQKLDLQLKKDLHVFSTPKNASDPFLFRNVTTLSIGNDDEWPKDSLRFLSTIFDLSHISKLSLSVNFTPDHISSTVSNISALFNQTSNLRSLLLYDYWGPENCMSRMKIICSMITSNVKHLRIRVKNIDDINYILERLEHLSSVTFEYAQILSINREEFRHSLAYLKRYSSLWDNQYALHVWLGNTKETL